MHDSQVGWLLILLSAILYGFRVWIVYADAANVTMDPWKGTTVVVGQLTGNVVIDDSSATKHSDGLRLDVIFATDATPRTITAGTRFTITGSPLTVAASKVRTLSFVSKAGAWVMTNDSGDV